MIVFLAAVARHGEKITSAKPKRKEAGERLVVRTLRTFHVKAAARCMPRQKDAFFDRGTAAAAVFV